MTALGALVVGSAGKKRHAHGYEEIGRGRSSPKASAGRKKKANSAQLPPDFSPGVRAILAKAHASSKLCLSKEPRIEPEHLLFVLLTDPDQWCSDALAVLKVDVVEAKRRLFGYINDRSRGEQPPS